MKINYGSAIEKVEAFDVRFPTSLEGDGSDAIHTDPDYSVCYVVISTSDGKKGFGMTFTLGKGTNIVCTAVDAMKFLLEGEKLDDIFGGFGMFWRKLTSESQLRWVSQLIVMLDIDPEYCLVKLGPEKGVMHLACSAIINALWDLWGRLEGKAVWQLLTDMEPEVSQNSSRLLTNVCFI